MTKNHLNPFPSKEQELLIRAALMPPEEAGPAWEEWNKLVDFEGYLDNGSFRLLPLLYKNLLNHKIQSSHIHRLRNVYLQSWYKNHKLFYESAAIILFLKNNGIPTIVLKGASLIALAYKDVGIRPMSDIDILVHYSQAATTIELLKSAGWKAVHEEYLAYNLKYGCSMMFKREDDFELDLHWHPFFESHGNHSESDFWEKAITVTISEEPTLSLCPSDLLLHTFIHGLRWNPEPPIRWIADAVYLLRNCSDQIDWTYFIASTRKYRVALQVREATQYLTGRFRIKFPDYVVREVNKIPVSLAERLLYRNALEKENETEELFFRKLGKLYFIYLRQANDEGLFRQIAGFIKFLRFRTAGKKRLAIIWYYLIKSGKTRA